MKSIFNEYQIKNIFTLMRKKIVYILIVLSGFANAQIVTIPDANFKAKLLSSSVFNTVCYGNGGYIKIDQNDDGEIQETEALVIDSLNVPFSNIINFSGISGFANLKKIDCSNNQINNLNVTTLSLLQELYCSNNCMGTLSVNGLSNLKVLDANSICVNNFDLTGLISLEYFSCISNGISLLNVSSLVSLKSLDCSNNSISSLTISGFVDLETINCGNNLPMISLNLSSLPALTNLYVFATNIGSLDLTSFTSLINVDCGDAGLSTLLVSNLPNLSYLGCGANSISNLDLSSLPALQNLQCGGNNFTTLDFSDNPNINYLECSSSLISNLDLSNLTNLNSFISYDGQFEELDFSSNPNLSLLILNTNTMLKRLFLKNGTIQDFNNNGLIECSSLEYICVDNNEISQIQNFIDAGSLTNVNISTYCSFTPGGNYNTIAGSMLFDANNNGCDVTDSPQSFIKAKIDDGNSQGTSFTNTNGNYRFFTQAGNFTITPIVEDPTWFTFSPANTVVNFADNNNNISTNDFCISANGVHPDVEMVIVPITPARPGFDAVYKLVYKNIGNQTVDVFLNFYYNEAVLDFVSESANSFNSGDGFRAWNFNNLLPFQSGSIEITLNVNGPTETPAVNIGDVLTFTSFIDVSTDENWVDNAFEYNQIVVGSYDPNNIECLQGDIVAPTEIGNYLHYVINFENTGNFQAENIVVKTTIDATKFDVNTLQIMNTSHNAYIKQTGNVIEFVFENIELDSGGHGNVLLKVKSQNTLVQGDMVSKRADIFFDYNFPIDTGFANTTFQALSNPSFETDNSISVSPNPTASSININGNFNIKTVQLYDVQGRLLQTIVNDGASVVLDVSSHQAGIYFIKATSDKGIKVEKIVKE